MVAPTGKLIALKRKVYEPYFSKQPGWAEQNPDVYWNSFCEAANALSREYPEAWENLTGVVVSTLRDTAVNFDTNGNVLRPAIIWLDQRKSNRRIRIALKDRLAFALVGMEKTVRTICANAKSNWLIDNEPEIWKNTDKYVMISGYFYNRLTGRWADSVASQIGHFPFDYKNRRWESSDSHWKWGGFGIQRDKLVELIEPGSVLGEVSSSASALTGLKVGLPVLAGGSDKGCETLGSGCVNEYSASMSFGTTATVQITTPRYIEPIRFMPAYPSVIKGYYNPEVEIFRGYWMITWFKKEFGIEEVLKAKEMDVSPEELLDHRLSEIPAGSQGLLLQPYWSPHVKTPIAKGAMIGFGEVHTRIHIYRAIVEGINYGLMDGMEKIESKSGIPITEIHVSGGGAQSDPVCQIAADMFGRKVYQPLECETSTIGAAMVGFVGLKIHENFEVAMQNMVHYKKIYEPNPQNHMIYRNLYKKAYQKIYPRLRQIYRDIKETIHYPAD
jgi:sugar (pentulose or hexulose) kinase